MKTARPHACGFAFPLPPSAFPSSFILHPYPSMQHCDALIVGGGPAGATCAAALRRRGLDVVVLDKATFPRAKLCAGWITPELFQTLAVDPAEYGRGRVLQAMTAFRVGRIGGPHVVVSYDRPVSFGIRRSELDDFLLRRAGAQVALGEAVQAIERRAAAGWSTARSRRRCWWPPGGIFARWPACWAWPRRRASPSWPPRNSESN